MQVRSAGKQANPGKPEAMVWKVWWVWGVYTS